MKMSLVLATRLLGYIPGSVLHVGAHKFEEMEDYLSLGFSDVIWFDPIEQFKPPRLPVGHSFERVAITNSGASSVSFKIYPGATGFSSIHEAKEKKLLHSSLGSFEEVQVPAAPLSNYQNKSTGKKVFLNVAAQGSEFSIISSSELSQIDYIIVLTSKHSIYKGVPDSYQLIKKYLIDYGFHLNLDLADLFFGHGFQYYSKEFEKAHTAPRAKFLLRISHHQIFSALSRGLQSLRIRIGRLNRD